MVATAIVSPVDRLMSRTGSNAAGIAANLDTEVGKAVVDMGLATKNEIDFCREQQKQSSDPNGRSLADLLVENSFITANQAKRIRSALDDRKKSQIPGYQLLGELGRGAMAKVYKARQISLDRIVAIKVLPRKMSENAEFVDRFYKEGKAALASVIRTSCRRSTSPARPTAFTSS